MNSFRLVISKTFMLVLIIFAGCMMDVCLAETSGDFSYTVYENAASIDGYSGSGTNVIIPDCIDGYKVTSISENAFQFNQSITSITIPNSITSIGSSAFYACTGLEEVAIPGSITSIGSSVFSSCANLKKVTIPNGVKSIGASAFYGCMKLEELTLPSSVVSIGSSAFSACTSLKTVTIPDSVKFIGASAFYLCSNIEELNIGSGITEIGQKVFARCKNLKQLRIPATVTCYSSYSDQTAASFCNCAKIEKVTLYGSGECKLVSTSEYCPWYYSKDTLTSVTISEGVTSIRSSFIDCKALTSVALPNSLITIGAYSFKNCAALKSIVIPCGVTNIEYDAFVGCSALNSVVFLSDALTIGTCAFEKCIGLEELTIPSGIKALSQFSFQDCTALKSIEFEEGIETIGEAAFYNCTNLKSIFLPESVSSVGNAVFHGCVNLLNVSFPARSLEIGEDIFYGCENLLAISCWQDTRADTWAQNNGYGNLIVYLDTVNKDNPLIRIGNLPPLEVGTSVDLSQKYVIIPEATANIAAFSSSEPDVANIDSAGVLTANGIGTTIISIYLKAKPQVTDSFELSVYKSPDFIELPEDIYIPVKSACTNLDERLIIKPIYATCTLTWVSDDQLMAEVDESGNVTGLSKGDVIIRVSTDNNLTAQTTVHITGRLSSAKFAYDNIYALQGESFIVIADSEVDGHTYRNEYMTFSSDNKDVVTVNEYGKLWTVGCGTATVSVTTCSGASTSCKVTVESEQVLRLPRDVEKIKESAFCGTTAKYVVINDGCTEIDVKAFENCVNLRQIIIPDSVTSIAENAFDGCSEAILVASADSFAYDFAIAHGIPCFAQ